MADQRPPDVSLAALDGSLRVDFQWQCDRFVHRVFVDQTEVGSSVEGDADDPWPQSPPLQQLSLEEINGSPVILGVGAAGQSHWSISVELDEQVDRASIKFDLACRSKGKPEFMGSTYRLADPAAISLLDDGSAVEQETLEQGQGSRLTIRAVALAAGTYRWAYRLMNTQQTTH